MLHDLQIKELYTKALSGIVEEDKLTWKNFKIINFEHGKPKD